MKYLNKIIFINSANIPYAEISVDGNVHFTGTQGVGKSTVLRALLFFYNADKHRLGIQSGQKSFDEFYFRQSNSYIIYEVMRDNGAYTVLISRYQGRASWRFIDAPYQRMWFIDEDKKVFSDWVKIRERIDKNVTVSARIDSGIMFKDIIFGNVNDLKYTRYALVKSSHYQNIPRSIQNVFLNTKLDADFVKDTIIQSMADEEFPIDLQTYRRLVMGFEREYDEIDCWFQQTRDGKFPVRHQALSIAEQGRKIVAFDQQLVDAWRMLNFVVGESENKIPLLEAKSAEYKEEIDKYKKREKELVGEFEKEKDSLNQKLGGKQSKLREISQKRKEFEGVKIKDKLQLSRQEGSLKIEQSEKQALSDNLLKAYSSIKEKYSIAQGKLDNVRQAFDNAQKEMLYKFKYELQSKREKQDAIRAKERKQLIDSSAVWRRESDERLQLLLVEQSKADNDLKELRNWHPKHEQIKAVKQNIRQLDVIEKENAAYRVSVESQMDKLQAEYDMEAAELKHILIQKQESINRECGVIREQLEKVNGILSQLEGSLYNWLNDNVDGWENTIGKIIDEDRVLYATGLDPLLENSSDCLFGIKLNLDNIESICSTPDYYKSQKKNYEEHLRKNANLLNQLQKEYDEDISKLSKKYTSLLNPLRQDKTRLSVEAGQIPTKRQNYQNEQHKLELEEQEIIEKEAEVRRRIFNEALLSVQKEKDEREKFEAKNAKALKDLDAEFNKAIKVLNAELSNYEQLQKVKARARDEEYAMQKRQLEKQEKAELSGKGVDVNLLGQYKKELDRIDSLLKQIEAERPIVIKYMDAEENLFSKEPEIRKELKEIERQLLEVRKRYDEKRARIENKRTDKENSLKLLQNELVKRRDGLNLYHQVVENEHIIPANFIADNKTIQTEQTIQQLLSQLRGSVNQKRESIDRLKDFVVSFNRNFKPQNAFHFNTMPVTDSDYLQIAADLQDFMDNNKIEDFRQRTSEHYKDILGRISSEIGALMKRRSDVDKVILDINKDFVEKNFAGVIRSIELRANESSDKLMHLLMSIHDYTAENLFSIGELNLFSNDNRDEVNLKVVDYLKRLSHQLQNEPNRQKVSLGDAFRLQFRVRENDNDTNWVERINIVGSDGTDILVKAMVNIMLINVFKKKAAKKSGDFIVHCMMDEIGRLHPNNIKGILQFANSRNIYLINSSPTSYNPYDYKYTYMLSKNGVKTRVEKLMKRI